LSKHKSNNFDGKFYQENNFEKNYRVEPNLSMNLPMVSTNVPVKVLKTTELHKCSSANDFFNEVAAEQELVSKKPFEGNSSNQAFILKPSYQNCNLEPLQIK
jgi:alpha-acetolactate decarboxylase